MKEWDVYINGRHVGTVFAKDENEARLAAEYKFLIADNDELSVNVRS